MNRLPLPLAVLLLALASSAPAGTLPNPVIFVTQVPMPVEINSRDVTKSSANVTTPFGNHLADPRYAGRGGALMILYPDGTVANLTALGGYGTPINGPGAPVFQGANSIAVRDPAVF